jgi:hypothetical protein
LNERQILRLFDAAVPIDVVPLQGQVTVRKIDEPVLIDLRTRHKVRRLVRQRLERPYSGMLNVMNIIMIMSLLSLLLLLLLPPQPRRRR